MALESIFEHKWIRGRRTTEQAKNRREGPKNEGTKQGKG